MVRALILTLLVGCSSDPTVCGTDAPASGMLAEGSAVSLAYETFTAGANHDCPAADDPIVSITIFALQVGDSGFLAMCIPHADRLNDGDHTIGLDQSGADITLVNVNGTDAGCTYALDRTQPASGTGHSEGLCDAGTNAAGFALVLDGSVALTRTCGGVADAITVQLHGRVAVLPQ